MHARIDLSEVHLWLCRAAVGGGAGSELTLSWWLVDGLLLVSLTLLVY